VLARDTLAKKTFNGNIVKEFGKEIETAFDEPETVEDHCFDDLGVAEIVVTGLGDGGIDHSGDLKGVVGAGDDAKMADGEDRGVIETVDERHKMRFSLKVDGSCGSGVFGKERLLLRMVGKNKAFEKSFPSDLHHP